MIWLLLACSEVEKSEPSAEGDVLVDGDCGCLVRTLLE